MKLKDYPWKTLKPGEAFDVPSASYSLGYVRKFACEAPAAPGHYFSVSAIPAENVYEVSLVPRHETPAYVVVRPARAAMPPSPSNEDRSLFEPARRSPPDRTFERG